MKKQKLYIKNDKGRYEPYKEPDYADKNVYKKVGRKYVPFGLYFYSEERLQDGLWLVRHRGASSSISNADHLASKWGLTKVGDIPVTDVTKLATADDIHRVIDRYLFDHFGFCVGNIPHQDISDELVSLIMNIGKEERNATTEPVSGNDSAVPGSF